MIVTGDLDDRSIRALGAAPVDGYGVGTGVVTGLGVPTAGLIYKLVSIGGRSVAKQSPGKRPSAGASGPGGSRTGPRRWSPRTPEPPPLGGRPLQTLVVSGGQRLDGPNLDQSRAWHQRALRELPDGAMLTLVRVD